MDTQFKVIIILSIVFGIVLLLDRAESLFNEIKSSNPTDRVVRKLALLPKRLDDGTVICFERYYSKEVFYIDNHVITDSEWKSLFNVRYYDQLPMTSMRNPNK